MSTRTKEEERALDEKIARIQRQNEEILRRRQEIEEDKRMAEENNAIVKLKPSSANSSRERTPALKPSNRELANNFTEDEEETEYHPPRQSRGGSRGRAIGERMRSRSDWKAGGGPPPDPRSFLYDVGRDERDVRNIRGKSHDIRGHTGDIQGNTGDIRGNTDRDSRGYQRGRRRGGMEYRGGRGRQSGGVRKNMEEEWRAERMKIDEARIQRQRAADGKWRREWDCDKLQQEAAAEPIHEQRKYNPHQDVRSLPNQSYVQGHGYTSPVSPGRHPIRGGVATRVVRGRGRLDPSELEMPLEKCPIPSKSSPIGDSIFNSCVLDPTRSVECVGESVKISIPNKGAVQSSPKPQRTSHGTRGRFRSQTSCSSQSDDDMFVDRSNQGGRRQRSQKSTKTQHKNPAVPSEVKAIFETLPLENKPPLPPFRAEQKPPAKVQEVVEVKEGDESWEDVTTSGTESLGEEMSSVNSSPLRRTMIISGKKNEAIPTSSVQSLEVFQNQPLDENVRNCYEEYIKQIEMGEERIKMEGKGLDAPELLESADTSSFDAKRFEENVEYPVLLQDFKTLTNEAKDSCEDKVVEFPLLLQDVDTSIYEANSFEDEDVKFPVLLQDDTLPSSVISIDTSYGVLFDSSAEESALEVPALEDRLKSLQIESSNMLVDDDVDCKENALVDVTKEGKDNVPEGDGTVCADKVEATPMVSNVNDVLHSQAIHLEPNTKDYMKTDGTESQLNQIGVEK